MRGDTTQEHGSYVLNDRKGFSFILYNVRITWSGCIGSPLIRPGAREESRMIQRTVRDHERPRGMAS